MAEHWLALVMVAGGGLIAWGQLRSRVDGVEKAVDTKAGRDVVDAHFDAVVQRLERIENKLDNARGL